MSRSSPFPLVAGVPLGLALLLTGACAGETPTAPPVSRAEATVPQHNTLHEDIDEVLSCPTFDVASVGTVDVRETIFFDEAGEPLRSQVHVKVRVVLTNLSTGKTIVDNRDFNDRVDFATGIIEEAGKFANIKDGIRIRDIGRFVFNPETGEIFFAAGPKDIGLSSDVTALFCAALA